MEDHVLMGVFKEVFDRFDNVDQRFNGIDKRLDGMDKRFDGIDKRLDGMDQRFDGLDQRFDRFVVTNQQEHLQMMQVIKELNISEFQIKRIK